jgi:hypothetical protein
VDWDSATDPRLLEYGHGLQDSWVRVEAEVGDDPADAV